MLVLHAKCFALSGIELFWNREPGALPRAITFRPVGAPVRRVRARGL
jgi:hypothetical protein